MTQKLARIRDTSSYGAVVSTTRAAERASVCPWYFPTVDDYTARLERAGFVAESVQLIPRPTPLPTGMRAWLETFANPFCAKLPEDQREGFLDDATEMLRPVLCDEKGRWTADYMRLRFLARKG